MATSTTPGPIGNSPKSGNVVPHRWNNRTLVSTAINLTRTHAAPPAASPRPAARPQSRNKRRGGCAVTILLDQGRGSIVSCHDIIEPKRIDERPQAAVRRRDDMRVVLSADGTTEGRRALQWCLDHLGHDD